jgi:spore maturation protein CgeB
MREALGAVLNDSALASSLAQQGRRTILKRHTCGHRVDELMDIYGSLTNENALEPSPLVGAVASGNWSIN